MSTASNEYRAWQKSQVTLTAPCSDRIESTSARPRVSSILPVRPREQGQRKRGVAPVYRSSCSCQNSRWTTSSADVPSSSVAETVSDSVVVRLHASSSCSATELLGTSAEDV